jgi:hypothetical protein
MSDYPAILLEGQKRGVQLVWLKKRKGVNREEPLMHRKSGRLQMAPAIAFKIRGRSGV